MSTKKPTLDELLAAAKNHVMTPEEREAQRQSWVRGEMGLDRPGGDHSTYRMKRKPVMSAITQAAEALRRLIQFNEELCADIGVSKHYPSAENARLALAAIEAEQSHISKPARIWDDQRKLFVDPPNEAEQSRVQSPATVEELDRILNSESDEEIDIWSDGTVHPKGTVPQSRVPEDRERLAKELEEAAEGTLYGDEGAQMYAPLMRKAAAALRLPTPGWRGIESAPLGEVVLLTNGAYVDCGRVGYFLSNTASGRPTHWQPLPSPPAEETKT